MLSGEVSHYSIRGRLGAGGMGEVYLAYDNNLNRAVALKVLSPEMAQDKVALARFLQEARAASVLHHANVAHIYEIGAEGPTHFIVMEHIEGQTLESTIGGKPMDVTSLMNIALQTADALEEAHRHGIIHRDIKPHNIMITSRGHAKVLDFGLAAITTQANPDTCTQVATGTGVVLGTVQFMSPEQALG